MFYVGDLFDPNFVSDNAKVIYISPISLTSIKEELDGVIYTSTIASENKAIGVSIDLEVEIPSNSLPKTKFLVPGDVMYIITSVGATTILIGWK